jgi:hypothetical protein
MKIIKDHEVVGTVLLRVKGVSERGSGDGRSWTLKGLRPMKSDGSLVIVTIPVILVS